MLVLMELLLGDKLNLKIMSFLKIKMLPLQLHPNWFVIKQRLQSLTHYLHLFVLLQPFRLQMMLLTLLMMLLILPLMQLNSLYLIMKLRLFMQSLRLPM